MNAKWASDTRKGFGGFKEFELPSDVRAEDYAVFPRPSSSKINLNKNSLLDLAALRLKKKKKNLMEVQSVSAATVLKGTPSCGTLSGHARREFTDERDLFWPTALGGPRLPCLLLEPPLQNKSVAPGLRNYLPKSAFSKNICNQKSQSHLCCFSVPKIQYDSKGLMRCSSSCVTLSGVITTRCRRLNVTTFRLFFHLTFLLAPSP